eukprot:537354-Prymnesium_polylepis.1
MADGGARGRCRALRVHRAVCHRPRLQYSRREDEVSVRASRVRARGCSSGETVPAASRRVRLTITSTYDNENDIRWI